MRKSVVIVTARVLGCIPSRLLLPGVLLGLSLSVPSPSPASAETSTLRPLTCHGKKATKVGKPDHGTVTGTMRADVIVSNGVSNVYGLGGSDTICITGTTPGGWVRVDDGGGDDWIRVTTSPDKVIALLGGGDDSFFGSARRTDRVGLRGAGRDVVKTFGGSDSVDILSRPGNPGHAKVDTGSGNDDVSIEYGPSNNPIDGGSGKNRLNLRFESNRAWTIDNRVGEARAGGGVEFRWEHFATFDLTGLAAPDTSFSGSSTDERVFFWDKHGFDEDVTERSVNADMGAGNDQVFVNSLQSGFIGGGTGIDKLVVNGSKGAATDETLVVDLGQGTSEASSSLGVGNLLLGGIQDVGASYFTALSLTGNADPNHLGGVVSCYSTFDGAGGDDVMIETRVCGGPVEDPQFGTVSMNGGPGDDTMTGTGESDDYLNGGDGDDVADGRGGTDTCIAETETNCELD